MKSTENLIEKRLGLKQNFYFYTKKVIVKTQRAVFNEWEPLHLKTKMEGLIR